MSTGSLVEPVAVAGLPDASGVGVVAVAELRTEPVTSEATATVRSSEIVWPFGRPTSSGVAHVTTWPMAEHVKPPADEDET